MSASRLLSFSLQNHFPVGAGLPAAMRWRAMLAIVLGIGMSSLDTAIANTALPAMARALSTTESRSVWVVSSYQLAMVACLLPFAALGEIVGHRRVMLFGLVLFTLASLACGLAPTLNWLVFARVLQGVGAAGVMSVNGALLRFIFPDNLLGRGVGLNSLTVAVSFAAGPTAASLILSVASWHWLFLINVPIGVVAVGYCLSAMPPTPRATHRFDVWAALLAAGFLGLLVFGLNEGAQHLSVGDMMLSAGAALVCLVILLWRERGRPAPLLALDLLRRPVFALSAATSTGAFATQSLAFIALPFLFQNQMGFTQVETGFLITPWPVLVGIMAPIAGRLSDRHSAGALAGLGLTILAAGMVLLATMAPQPSIFDIAWRMALCGAGFGFFQSPNVRALMTSAPAERSGGASGMVGTVRLLGQSSGAALVAACFHASTGAGALLALWLGAAFAALAGVASVLRLRYGRTG